MGWGTGRDVPIKRYLMVNVEDDDQYGKPRHPYVTECYMRNQHFAFLRQKTNPDPMLPGPEPIPYAWKEQRSALSTLRLRS